MPNDMTQPLQALRHANVIRHERMRIAIAGCMRVTAGEGSA